MRSLLGAAGRGDGADWAEDLMLEPLVRALALSGRYAGPVREVLTGLCVDPETIRYRQDVLDDLLGLPALCDRLEGLLPAVGGAAQAGTSRWAGEAGIF